MLVLLLLFLACPVVAADMNQSSRSRGGAVQTLYSVVNSTFSPAIAGELDLYKYMLPANTMSAEGDTLFVRCESTTSSVSSLKNLSVRFAGSLLASSEVTTTNSDWTITAMIRYRSSALMRTHGARQMDGTVGNTHLVTAWDPTIANEIRCIALGGGVAADVEGGGMLVQFRPAP